MAKGVDDRAAKSSHFGSGMEMEDRLLEVSRAFCSTFGFKRGREARQFYRRKNKEKGSDPLAGRSGGA